MGTTLSARWGATAGSGCLQRRTAVQLRVKGWSPISGLRWRALTGFPRSQRRCYNTSFHPAQFVARREEAASKGSYRTGGRDCWQIQPQTACQRLRLRAPGHRSAGWNPPPSRLLEAAAPPEPRPAPGTWRPPPDVGVLTGRPVFWSPGGAAVAAARADCLLRLLAEPLLWRRWACPRSHRLGPGADSTFREDAPG